jgi:hypothetical protein
VKSPQQVLGSVENRIKNTWQAQCAAAAGQVGGRSGELGDEAAPWPHAFPLGSVSGAELASGFAAYRDWAEQWWDWARDRPCALHTQTRVVAGTRQKLPSHLAVETLDDAAALCGDGWPARVAVGRARAAAVYEQFPAARVSLANRVRELADLSDVDFSLLVAAAGWFTHNNACGLTPRQVPIEGLHAKWLDSRQHLVAALAGLPDLGLVPPHPPRIHFTYLDPDHLAAGGRRHDSATVGDVEALAYLPRVVLISENKDTAVHFPAVPAAVAVEGAGFGGKTAAQFSWITGAPLLLYWGDLDAHGLEILDGYRRDGVPVRSVLMDEATYVAFARFGTDLDVKGMPLTARSPRETRYLSPEERALYERLTGTNPRGPRRIEQERITLATATRALAVLLDAQQQLVGTSPS